jgi:hypothetical protein
MVWLPLFVALSAGAPALSAGALAPSVGAPDEPPPEITLYTMGPGDDVFSTFGHGALCVRDRLSPQGRCYNYGTTDFSRPGKLIWDFLRGRALFWVSVTSEERLKAFYIGERDRTLYRQILPLPPDQARALAIALDDDTKGDKKFYIYHHYHENCTTRLRDHMDQVTGGKLREGADVPYGPTYRELSARGFARSTGLLVGTETLIGRPGDLHPTLYQAMFLPDVMRAEVEKRLGAKPELIYQGRPRPAGGSVARGRWVLYGAALALAALALAGFAIRRRWSRRISLVVTGLTLGLVGLGFEALAIVSVRTELRRNELLLVFLCTDLALIGLSGRWLRRYLTVRVAGLVLVALAKVVGLLVQPIWPDLLMVLLPIGVMAAFELLPKYVRRASPGTEQGLLSSAGRGDAR